MYERLQQASRDSEARTGSRIESMNSAGQNAPQTIGFEVDRTQPSSFLNALYRAGFDEHFASLSGPNGGDKRTRLDQARRLWEVCLEHESSVPGVRSPAVVDAAILKDRALIASVRATCCEVWLAAWEQGRGSSGLREGTAAFLQIVEWVLQACDSLILCRQYSALCLLLERVNLGMVLEAAGGITGGDGKAKGEAKGEADVVERTRPVMLAIKMLMYRAYASMQCKTTTAALSAMGASVSEARRVLDPVAALEGDEAQVYCDSECLSVAMKFAGMLLDAEELDAAHELIKALSGIVCRLREKDEELGRAWEARLVVSGMWCGRVKEIETGRTSAERLVALSLEGLRCLEDVEDLDPGLDARGEASRRLDAIVRGSGADVAEALGKACAAMVPRRRGVRLVLSTYAWTFQCSSGGDVGSGGGTTVAPICNVGGAPCAFDGRRTFLLSVLGNLSRRFDASFASSCPDACEVISSLLSNRIVVRSLRVDVGLARDMHVLLWNAACDADLAPIARVWLLSSAKAMADLTQDVGHIRNALLSLARIRSQMWQFDVASELVNRAAQYDALAAAIVKLEIEAARSERSTSMSRSERTAGASEAAGHGLAHVDVAAVKELSASIFRDEAAFSVHDGLDLACRFMEVGDTLPRRIVGGILLDEILRLAVSSSSPDLALLVFQNLIVLARSTKHPTLMEFVYSWMEGEPAGLDITRVIVAKGGKPQRADIASASIHGLRFAANHATSMAIDELREGSPARAQTAAMFAARVLDALSDVDPTGRAKHAVASQVCWILASNAACLSDEDINPGTLIAGLEDRSSRIRSDSRTVDTLSFHAKLSAVFVHIKNGSDLRASDELREIRQIFPEAGATTLLLDVLGRLPPSMPLTLKQALEISLEVLTPDHPAYFEAIRALMTMPCMSNDDARRLVGQVHELLASLINETPQTSEPSLASFIEWFYVHAWNVGARTTALEGMELHNLLGQRQRALLVQATK